jgi:hypothetical protein
MSVGMMALIVLGILVLGIIGVVTGIYNSLITVRNNVQKE